MIIIFSLLFLRSFLFDCFHVVLATGFFGHGYYLINHTKRRHELKIGGTEEIFFWRTYFEY